MKQDMSILALQHTKQMEKEYLAEIGYSINESEIFRDDSNFRERIHPLKNANSSTLRSKLINIDSVKAIFLPEIQKAMAEGKKVAVLNFASFKNPGGKFLNGSTAQEECLCYCSYLYNVLESFYKEYYIPNQQNTYCCLYNNSALYSGGIRFWNIKPGSEKITEDTPSTIVDVITCAAPNKSAAKRYYDINSKQILDEYIIRLSFLKLICEIKKVDILIAGAWGCGVFGNDPRDVATAFKTIFNKDQNIDIQYPNLILHPVPGAPPFDTRNFFAFRRVFSDVVPGTENNEYPEWF